MKKEAEKLRFELDRIGTRRGRCIAPELKQKIVLWVSTQRANGRSVSEIAAQLGVSEGSVFRWSSGMSTKAMVPVRVIADEVRELSYVVVSPSGFRVEGLSIQDAARLLRELG